MSIKSRLDKLEAAAPDDVASRLGDSAVVTRLPDGRYRVRDGRELTPAELNALLKGATGKLLVLRNWR